ncbi:MAG: 4'-phosphopantetheinyl transferase superfamily protein [Desulfatitalea sp.]|nr:4'-phosphopantetheinyl transferase superfamily protein [Desulfatitalea sp.]NNJ99769.1 4'-phosphopantetheinyl transferase superfamily protein [Desulfatitalea sp.]
MDTIHPVIMPVSVPDQRLVRRAKVQALRRQARAALALSARFSGLALGKLEKADTGAPLPSAGTFWALSHKSTMVAAVAARHPIGIDIERIQSISPAMEKRLAGDAEWQLAPTKDLPLFFRYWTAKEAVLKAVGVGLTGLSRCRVQHILDANHLILSYDDQPFRVTHHWVSQTHLVAITSGDAAIAWHFIEN